MRSTYWRYCIFAIAIGLFGIQAQFSHKIEAGISDQFHASSTTEPRSIEAPFIVGGEIVTNPPSWIVQIYKDNSPFCTGTLVYPQWVLSAGHCGTFEGQTARLGGSTAHNGDLVHIESSFVLNSASGNLLSCVCKI